VVSTQSSLTSYIRLLLRPVPKGISGVRMRHVACLRSSEGPLESVGAEFRIIRTLGIYTAIVHFASCAKQLLTTLSLVVY
jgi:hypothetical protein